MSASSVPETYVDAFGERREVDPRSRAAVLGAMGLEERNARTSPDPVAVARPGGALAGAGVVVLEDGADLGRIDRLPPDAPFGYHRLIRDDGTTQLLITGPGRCHLPAGLRAWGWAVQLAAVRSSRSWGIGDLGDLRRLSAWSAEQGAGFVTVSPLGAPNPGPDPEPSPYYPSSRRFGNPLHLSLEEVAAGPAEVAAARRLNRERVIDRAAVLASKRAVLERAWVGRRRDDGFDRWRAAQDGALERWAAFCVLTERFGPGWRGWPAEYHDPTAPAVTRVLEEAGDAVAFHAWLQWCFDRQLAAASKPLRRIADMPVGVDPGGFDAWDWQDELADGVTVGAPPDRFNPAGQDWGLPPLIPHRLREAGYRPFIDTLRAQLRHAGGLRIDHVLGLFRLWWIPGDDPTRGAYVRYPTDELLEIVALESHRAGAVVIGEDLGTVPPGVRRELRRRRMLSTRLALFERVPPSRYPRQAFAAITTHDLPTIAGIVTGADLDDQLDAGVEPDGEGLALLRRRLVRAAGTPSDASLDELVVALHGRLAGAPSALVAATLEDALGVTQRPNLPGTTSAARSNWSLALPKSLEEIERDPRVAELVRALAR